MLVLKRGPEESITIDGMIVVKILRIIGSTQVSIGIDAPRDVEIVRTELLAGGTDSAATDGTAGFNHEGE